VKFEQAATILNGIPYTNTEKGRFFYDFILKHRPMRVLELGFAHGVSTCYQAAALQEYGGKIDCVDLEGVPFDPDVETLAERLGLTDVITPHREASTYTWFLKKVIEAQTHDGVCEPLYDFIFIDGPKDWTVDGAAFFMADKLLKQDGWIMFDDYDWTYYGHHPGRTEGYVFKTLSQDELTKPQIEAVFRLLAMQHPDYSNFEVRDDQLAYGQKTRSEVKTIRYSSRITPGYAIERIVRRFRRHAPAH
jgi:predicted O-methyltransferase YrrM